MSLLPFKKIWSYRTQFTWASPVKGVYFNLHLIKKPDCSRYDLILGRNFNLIIGLEVFNGSLALISHEVKVPIMAMVYCNYSMIDYCKCHRCFGQQEESPCQVQTLDAKYDKSDLNEVNNNQSFILQQQKENMKDILLN